MALDPDDPRPPYLQVAASLRAAILTRKYGPGEKLPSQTELAKHYGVARMTVQQALRILRDEGLTVSRQGSGVFARERTEKPVGLRPHIELAFEAEEVTIDFAGYTAETLHGAVTEPLDKIRAGRLTPSSVRIRILTADMTRDLAWPLGVDHDPATSEQARARIAEIGTRHISAIVATVEELQELGLVAHATVETRTHASAPAVKAYIINGTDVFFGFYPVAPHNVKLDGERVPVIDSHGKDAVLFHFTDDGDPESQASAFVAQTRTWFESTWEHLATQASR